MGPCEHAILSDKPGARNETRNEEEVFACEGAYTYDYYNYLSLINTKYKDSFVFISGSHVLSLTNNMRHSIYNPSRFLLIGLLIRTRQINASFDESVHLACYCHLLEGQPSLLLPQFRRHRLALLSVSWLLLSHDKGRLIN